QGAGVDEGVVVVAVALARVPPVIVGVRGIVLDSVAVLVDAVEADLLLREHLAHACPPAQPVGVAHLCARFARADVLVAGRAEIARRRVAGVAHAGAVDEGVRLTAVHGVAVAVGVVGVAHALLTHAVLAQDRRVGDGLTEVVAGAAVVLVGREVEALLAAAG